MTETWKIARACFVGGAACCAVALLIAPAFFWLGIIAGFCAGYLAYEFREVLHAIPLASYAVGSEFKALWLELCHAGRKVKVWFAEQHPYVYGAIVLGFSASGWFVYAVYPFPNPDANNIYGVCAVFFLSGAVLYFVSVAVLALSTEFGQQFDKMYEETQPYTYTNVYYWILLGLAHVALYFLWRFWGHLGIGIWRLVHLIHSHKRTLCAVDGTLGGIVALVGFAYYGPTVPTLGEYAVVVLSGGFIGAMLGVADWKLLSKCVFNVRTGVT